MTSNRIAPRGPARVWLWALLALTLGAFVDDAAQAQPYPNRAIRLVAAAPPGGALDALARIVAENLSPALGQPVVVDNKPGAGGNIAAEIVAKAPADGYTMLMVSVSHVINPSLYASLAYDPVRDFVAVTQVDSAAYVFVVAPGTSMRTMDDLVALSKTKPGGLNYASSGTGQASHLGVELFKTLSGARATHVPYKGDGPAILDVMGGSVDTFMASIPGALPLVKAGKLRALAVTGAKRSELMPDVPTVTESGYPGFTVTGFRGILLPAGVPRDVVAKLHAAIAKGLADPQVRDRVRALGAEPVGNSPEEFAAFLNEEMGKWTKVVKASGAKAE
jgi:tripartite-type tricarboxylate transporter receptor subunit TctC